MGERTEKCAAPLEKLISDKRYRGIVEAIVGRAGEIPNLDRIGLVTLAGARRVQKIFMFAHGADEAKYDDQVRVNLMVEDVCKSAEDRDIVGFVPMTTDSEFRDDQKTFGISEPVILWQRQPQLTSA